MSENALAVQNQQHDLIVFDEEKTALIKRTVAKDATNDELALFLHQCKRTGLDPLAKQIYFQKYQTKNGPQIAIITGIDGYRLVASRSGLYAGNDEPVFEGRKQYNGVDVPIKATVTVWRFVQGQRVPFSASVYWDEYCPNPPKDYQWKKMPHVMMAKCAEAAALRKAFPADLGSVYTAEEMQQSPMPIIDVDTGEYIDGDIETEPQKTTGIPPAAMRKFHAIGREKFGEDWDSARAALISTHTNGRTESAKDITLAEMTAIAEEIKALDSDSDTE